MTSLEEPIVDIDDQELWYPAPPPYVFADRWLQGRRRKIVSFLKSAKIPNPEFWTSKGIIVWLSELNSGTHWAGLSNEKLKFYHFFHELFRILKLDNQLCQLRRYRIGRLYLFDGYEDDWSLTQKHLANTFIKSPEVWQQMDLLPQSWSPKYHHKFDTNFKNRVFAFLCCNLREGLPQYVVHQIVANLCAMDARSFDINDFFKGHLL